LHIESAQTIIDMKHLLALTLLTLGLLAQAQIPSYVPTNGLVGWWPFNGNANDESGNGNNGTVNGATLAADRFGNAGKAYSFDGNDWIEVRDDTSINLKFGTISAWFKTANTSQTLIVKNEYGTARNENFGIGIWGNSYLSFYKKYNSNCSPGVGWIENRINTAYNNNLFYNITCVIDSFSLKTYINGVFVNSTQTPNSSPDFCSGSNLFFGRDYALNQLNNFRGILDDIAIYNRALTAAEVQQLYSGNSTLNASVTSSVPGKINYQGMAMGTQRKPIKNGSI
jgi:hypothetical protein